MSLVFDVTSPLRDFVLDIKGTFSDKATGVSGPSGAGKSTFFKLLSGIETPVRGHILLNGKVLFDSKKNINLPVYKRRIGMVFQEKLLFPHLSVKKNLNFSEPYVLNRSISFFDVVDMLDLSNLLDAKPCEISGGEQQRVAIGRALLSSPEILLLDEPFNAVDRTLRSGIIVYLKRLKKELDIPMIIVSHDPEDLAALADSVYYIDKGRQAQKIITSHSSF